MSADLYIHIIETDEQERHVKEYLRADAWDSSDGNVEWWWVLKDGRRFRFNDLPEDLTSEVDRTESIKLDYDKDVVEKTENIWIGEVSWLKASLFDDQEKYVPGPIRAVQDLIPNIVEITDEFIQEIEKAMKAINNTTYRIEKSEDVVKFLRKHKGNKAFVISW